MDSTCTMDFKTNQDTICAIATPVGEGGIGIIRISGPEAVGIAQQLFRPTTSTLSLKSHRLYHGWILDPSTRQRVDEVLLSYMAAPRTYTREDVVEINCHSGYAVLERILELAIRAGARLAEPGEFTRRAFLSGRIDLSQAEAIIDVIHARSEKSLALASRHLSGDLRDRILQWREVLLQFQALTEASIDFSEDLEDASSDSHLAISIQDLDKQVIAPLKELLDHFERGRVLREGITLVLVGKPNVGKSSLLNALLGKDRAIVTPVPGTTRDVIEETFLLSGILVRILDTAGIRHSPDEIESIGIERTLRSVEDADVVLWLMDQSRPLTEEDDTIYASISSSRHMLLLNKHDLPPAFSMEEAVEKYPSAAGAMELSALNSSDIERLREQLSESFLKQPLESCNATLISNLRQRDCLERAMDALLRGKELLLAGGYGELVTEEIHLARQQLESVLGWNEDEDLLDRIFSQFCIGK
jgi:tRNA modification GTPase